MHHLQKTGYYTTLIGKHHFLDRFDEGVDLCDDDEEIHRYGFDHVLQIAGEGGTESNLCPFRKHLRAKGLLEAMRREKRTWMNEGRYPYDEEDFSDGFLGRKAVEFVEGYGEERPFYLNLSFLGPHPPFWTPGAPQHSPDEVAPPLGEPDTMAARIHKARYLDRCLLIDRQIGRLTEALERRGMLETTVFIFTSDHGDDLGDHGHWGKRFFYDTIANVPLVMTGPGVPRKAWGPRPGRSKAMVSHLDLYPAILGLAGADMGPCRDRPGRDACAVLREEVPARDEIVCELGTAVMVRTANWKLVFDPEQGGVQNLYNLLADPDERRNLAGAPGYEAVIMDHLARIAAHHIRLFQTTNIKEEHRLQRVRITR